MPQTNVPLVKPVSRDDMERWADQLLGQYYPDSLTGRERLPVDDILDRLLPQAFQIDFGIDDLPAGVEGIAEPPNRLTIGPDVFDALGEAGRARFTGCHEAVHALVHLPQLTQRLVSGSAAASLYRRSEVPTYRDPEWQANRGAAALLMPARATWALIERHGYTPEPLLETFGVSRQAASHRIDDAANGRLWRPPLT